MKLNTTSGLRGDVVALIQVEEGEHRNVFVAIVKSPDAVYPSRPYSTHRLYEEVSAFDQRSTWVAEAGHYDLSFEAAQLDLLERAGWPLP